MDEENVNNVSQEENAEENKTQENSGALQETNKEVAEPTQEKTPTSSIYGEEEPKNGGNPAFLVLVIAIIAVLGACVYGFTNGKSKAEKFANLLTSDYLVKPYEEMSELYEKDGKITSEVSFDLGKLFKTMSEENVTGIEKVKIRNDMNKNGKDFSNDSILAIDSSDLITIRTAKTGDLYGMKVIDLMDEYVAVENKNLKALAEKLGADEEIVKVIPDKIDEKNLEKFIKDISEIENENSSNFSEEKFNKIVEKFDMKKFEKIAKKYIKIALDELNDDISESKNEKITINGKEISLTKHTLTMDGEDIIDILFEVVKVLKDDKELYNMIADLGINEDFGCKSFDDWKNNLGEAYTELEEEYKKIKKDDEMLKELKELKIVSNVYAKGKDTYAIECECEAPYSEKFSMRLAGLHEKENSYIEFSMSTVDDEKVVIAANTKKEKNKYATSFEISADVDSVSVKLDLFDFSVEYDSKASLEKIEKSNALVVNDKELEELEEYFNGVFENSSTYVENITKKLPEKLVSAVTSAFLGNGGYNDYDYDQEYSDYDYDDYDYDYDDYDFNFDDYDFDYDYDDNTSNENDYSF